MKRSIKHLGRSLVLASFFLTGCGGVPSQPSTLPSAMDEDISYALTLSGEELGTATAERLKSALAQLPDTDDKFLILTPSKAVGESLYMQTALLGNGSYELEVCLKKGEKWTVYGANYSEARVAEQVLLAYLQEQRVPDCQNWEIVVEQEP